MVLVRVGWQLYEIAPVSSKANRSRPWSECENSTNAFDSSDGRV